MALSYLFDPNKQFQDKNGVNNVGGYLYVFINDSDDHAPTYCNFTGTLNPERIVLDNNGRAVVIVDELKTYRIEVYDRSGNMLWSQYPVRPTNVIYGDYNVYNADIYGTPDEIDVDVETSASGVKKFTIKLANAVKTVIGNIQDTISSIVETVSTKADKVQGATAGNLAALDANGNLADSGKKTADFKTKQTAVSVTGGTLKGVASMSQNANGEVTLTLNDIQDGTTVQKGVVRLNNAIDSTSTTEAATPKAVKDAYDDLNNKIVARAVFLSQAEWAVQSHIPGDPAKVYYVENGTGEDAYTVYVWKESTSEYVEVDESSIDLDGYWHDAPNTTGTGNVVTNITLGNDGIPQVVKGITALTQHQSVTDNNPTLAWGTTSTVGTVGSTGLRVTMPSNPASDKSPATHTHSVKINGATKTIPATGDAAVDLGTYLTSHQDISGKLDKTGDVSNTTSTFTKASGDTSSMASGGKLSAIFTAISSFFASLKALAFKDKVSTGDISDDAITAEKVKDNETLPVNISGAASTVALRMDSRTYIDISWAKVSWSDFCGTGADSLIQKVFGSNYGSTERTITVIGRVTSCPTDFDTNTGIPATAVNNGTLIGVKSRDAIFVKFFTNAKYGGQFPVYEITFGLSAATGVRSITKNVVISSARQSLHDGAGSTTTPVYVDSDGQVQPCTPSSMYVGWASNVNLSKTVNAVNGDSIQAGTGSSVTIGNAGNAKKWDGHAISVGTVVSSAGTISIA